MDASAVGCDHRGLDAGRRIASPLLLLLLVLLQLGPRVVPLLVLVLPLHL